MQRTDFVLRFAAAPLPSLIPLLSVFGLFWYLPTVVAAVISPGSAVPVGDPLDSSIFQVRPCRLFPCCLTWKYMMVLCFERVCVFFLFCKCNSGFWFLLDDKSRGCTDVIAFRTSCRGTRSG